MNKAKIKKTLAKVRKLTKQIAKAQAIMDAVPEALEALEAELASELGE